MANDMTTNITISGNKELMIFLEGKHTEVDYGEDRYLSFVDAFYDDMENDRVWFTDNVGAKWCYHEDFWVDDNEAGINLISAWHPPIELIEKLYEVCVKVDENCEIIGTYQDESFSPVGGFIMNDKGFNSEEVVLEYPNENDYIGDDGEVDDELYESATEDFYNNLWDIKDGLLSEAIRHSKLVETEN
jgi:hypothetical protein